MFNHFHTPYSNPLYDRSDFKLYTLWEEPTGEGDMERDEMKKVARIDQLFRSLAAASRGWRKVRLESGGSGRRF